MKRVTVFFFLIIMCSSTGWSLTPGDTLKTPSRPFLKGAIAPLALVTTGLFFQFDHPLHDKQRFHGRVQPLFPETESNMENYLRYAPAPAVYVLDWVGVKARNRFVPRTILLVKSQLLMSGIVFGLKEVTGVPRPNGDGFDAFPSGTAAQAFLTATFFHYEMGHHSPWLTAGGYAMATFSAMMRLAKNRHWLADLLIGAGIGMGSTHLVYWAFETPVNRWSDKRFGKDNDTSVSLMPMAAPGFAGVAASVRIR